MNCMKRQNYVTRKDEPPKSEGVQYANRKEWKTTTNSSRKIKWLGQRWSDIQLFICLVMKVKSDAAKNSTAQEPGMLGPWIKVNQM